MWVYEEMDRNPDVSFTDRFGRRNMEYISLGCDNLPVLRGRSPLQAYSDFMMVFRDTFRYYLGCVITGIHVGLGPGGELRYPSFSDQKLTREQRSHELGEFQCFDKYMLASMGPEGSEFVEADGSLKKPYVEFFLEWYSSMLLLHGERICWAARAIFYECEVDMSGKMAGIHWHNVAQSHPSELTAGYYNTAVRDGFTPTIRMFDRHKFSICCTISEMLDAEERLVHADSRPESFLKQLMHTARICNVPLEGENFSGSLDEKLLQRVMMMSELYSDGVKTPPFSFNFVRMNKNLFELHNWGPFTRFVRQASSGNMF